MKNRPVLYVVAMILASIVFTSCFKDETNEDQKKEKAQIEEYVKTNNLVADSITANGLYYFSVTNGTGEKLTSYNDYAFIKYRGKYLDGTLFDASDSTEFNELTKNGKMPWQKIGGLFKISMRSNFYGMVEGLTIMKAGGKARFIMPSILSYGDLKPRIYEIDTLIVIKDIYAYEKQQFVDTMKRWGKADQTSGALSSDSTSTGAYVFKTGNNAGGNPILGDSVIVKYSGYIMDGRLFEKERIIRYILGYFPVSSFDAAILQMDSSTKAKVYVPFYRAYGSAPAMDRNTLQIIIPAYSSLKYNIELIDFKRKSKSFAY